MLTRTFHQGPGPGPGQGLHSQAPGQGPGFEYKDHDKDKDLSKCVTSVWTFQAFKLMQKTWEKYIDVSVSEIRIYEN